MTEPPLAPGEGNPSDPTRPFNPPSGNDPAPGSAPPPPPYGSPQPPPYGAPPPPGPGGYGPPPGPGAGGYGPPPGSGAGGYGPPPGQPYGYGPGPVGPGPAGLGTEDEKTWVLIAHFGGAILAFITGGWLGWVAPLISYVAKGNQSPEVRRQSVEALNFQLLWAVIALVITVISGCLSLIVIGLLGFILLIVPWLMGTIFGIIAGIKALNGEPYRYPGAPNWVK
jgi:uncharacterized protein